MTTRKSISTTRSGSATTIRSSWIGWRSASYRTGRDPWFKGVTQLVYDSRIGPLARALYHTHEILFADPQHYRAFEDRYQTVKKDYLEQLRLRKTNEGRFEDGRRAPL